MFQRIRKIHVELGKCPVGNVEKLGYSYWKVWNLVVPKYLCQNVGVELVRGRVRGMITALTNEQIDLNIKELKKHTLSGKTLSGEIFVGRNYSSGEIFVTKRKIRHFRPTKSFAR